MLDLSSIQDDYSKEYLSLEHLRAVIYKSKLEKNKTKGKNEKAFYAVTCSHDVLSLLKKEEGRGHIVNCYLLHPVTKIFYKVEFSHLIDYLEYLAYSQVDPEKLRYNPELSYEYGHYCEIGNHVFKNENFYFLRAEIEDILNVRIPYFDDVEDVQKIDLIPLHEEKEESTEDLNKEIERLKLELEEKDKKIAELQIALDDKNVPILLGAHRTDDPLKIAIEVRNKYWASYPDNVKSNAQIKSYIERDYNVTKTFAAEIEKVACPIDRKKV